MIIDEIFCTNILVLLICLIGFILEIKKGLKDKQILKKIGVNKLKEKIEILKNQRFQIDRLIIKRKNNKILWYFRTKLLEKIDRNEKNLEQYNIILKMFNKINKNNNRNNYKKIFEVVFSAPLIITIFYTFFSIIISYIFVLIRYIVLYHQLPSNIINIVDILNIMYRSISYLLFLFIFSIIISYLLFVLEKNILKITENNNIEELNYSIYFDKEKINSNFIILLFGILIIHNIVRIVILIIL